MSSTRKDFVNPTYESYLDHWDKVPASRRLWIGENDYAEWDNRIYLLGDYTWEPRNTAGRAKGSMGEDIHFTRPSSAGEDIEISFTDHDWDRYQQLKQWHHDATELRIFVEGEEVIIGKLVIVPFAREIPEVLRVQFMPFRGWHFNGSTTFDQYENAFNSGRTQVLVAADTDTFSVGDNINFSQYLKTNVNIIIESNGASFARQITSVVGTAISIDTPIGSLAAGDPVYTPGMFYGVFP